MNTIAQLDIWGIQVHHSKGVTYSERLLPSRLHLRCLNTDALRSWQLLVGLQLRGRVSLGAIVAVVS